MGKKPALSFPRRGEVYLVDFEPARGAEIRKTRPALIVQNDIGNRHSPLTIVAPLTTKFDFPLYPVNVHLRPPEGGISMEAIVLLDQLRSVDKARLVKKLGKLRPGSLHKVDHALMISLGLAEI